MSTLATYSPEIYALKPGETISFPYSIENERLLYIISGEAILTLQMHFKINSLGMLEAISSSLELNDSGQLVAKLSIEPETHPVKALTYYTIAQGSEMSLFASSEVHYTLIESKATDLLGFISSATNATGNLSPAEIVAVTVPVSEPEEPVVEVPIANTPPIKAAVPSDLKFEPKQKFYYYSGPNRSFFILQMIGLFIAAFIITAILPNMLGGFLFIAAIIYIAYMSYYEYIDVKEQNPVISLVDDGLIIHTRFYKNMPLLWSEILELNLVVRENFNGSDLVLELIQARPETKVNYLTPGLKWFFNQLTKQGYKVELPRIQFKKSDFDMEVETLKHNLTLAKSKHESFYL